MNKLKKEFKQFLAEEFDIDDNWVCQECGLGQPKQNKKMLDFIKGQIERNNENH